MQQVSFKSLIDPFSILVINKDGYLRRLFCPFRVLCITTAPGVTENAWYYVDKVEQKENNIVYVINLKPYSYSHFHIYIMF